MRLLPHPQLAKPATNHFTRNNPDNRDTVATVGEVFFKPEK